MQELYDQVTQFNDTLMSFIPYPKENHTTKKEKFASPIQRKFKRDSVIHALQNGTISDNFSLPMADRNMADQHRQ